MTTYVPVSRVQHADKRWRRPTSYRFAATDHVAPLVAQELPKAVMMLPVGFIATKEGFALVAVQGLLPRQNLLVLPDGRWAGGYTPAVYRGYPFALGKTTDGRRILCVDEESELLTTDRDAEPFFADDGAAAELTQGVLEFLTQVHSNREVTLRACALLQKHELIQPWPVKVSGPGGEQQLEWLYRIDEARFNALPADALEELREGGCLPIIYCQLLSMQHLARLGELGKVHAQLRLESRQRVVKTGIGDQALVFPENGGTINFGGDL